MKRKTFITLSLSTLGLTSLSKVMADKPYAPSFGMIAGQKMVEYGQKNLGKRTPAASAGECTDFISAALAYAGARGGNFSKEPYYTWGTPIKVTGSKKAMGLPTPGEIVQFVNCTFKSGYRTDNFPKHTALCESANGYNITFLHQNVNGQRVVVRTTLDMSGFVHDGGTYKMFVPVKA